MFFFGVMLFFEFLKFFGFFVVFVVVYIVGDYGENSKVLGGNMGVEYVVGLLGVVMMDGMVGVDEGIDSEGSFW